MVYIKQFEDVIRSYLGDVERKTEDGVIIFEVEDGYLAIAKGPCKVKLEESLLISNFAIFLEKYVEELQIFFRAVDEVKVKFWGSNETVSIKSVEDICKDMERLEKSDTLDISLREGWILFVGDVEATTTGQVITRREAFLLTDGEIEFVVLLYEGDLDDLYVKRVENLSKELQEILEYLFE